MNEILSKTSFSSQTFTFMLQKATAWGSWPIHRRRSDTAPEPKSPLTCKILTNVGPGYNRDSSRFTCPVKVLFDWATMNVGNGYDDENSSAFKCPVPGLYAFFLSAMNGGGTCVFI